MLCKFTLALTPVCVQCPIWPFQYPDFVLSRSVAQVLSEWFWDGSSCSSYYRYFIIIIIIISFMQGIYTYIPKTNHVRREYSVSAILSLLFMVSISLVPALALLYFYVSTFRIMCAVPNMAVFCSSFTSWFPGMLLMYFLDDFCTKLSAIHTAPYHFSYFLSCPSPSLFIIIITIS